MTAKVNGAVAPPLSNYIYMAIGFINGNTIVDSSETTKKQFQVDTTNTLMDDIRCYWPMRTSHGVAGEPVPELMNVAPLKAIGLAQGLDTDSPTGGLCTQFNEQRMENDYPYFLATGCTGNSQNVSYWFSYWLRLDSKTTYRPISQWGSVGNRCFVNYYNSATDRLHFDLSEDGGTNITTLQSDNFGAMSASTWYHVIFGHDADDDETFITINNGTEDTAAHSTGASGRNTPLVFGGYDGVSSMVGNICHVGYWVGNRPSAQQKTDLYNSGNGNELI